MTSRARRRPSRLPRRRRCQTRDSVRNQRKEETAANATTVRVATEIDDTTASDVDKVIEIPMTYDGMSFVLDYYIGEASVRGVVDTGSPFITIRGGERERKLGFRDEERYHDRVHARKRHEIYGLQVDSSTVWCLGDLRFVTTRDNWSLREMV